MQIDRSNYEIWLIDWLDGNLNDLQVEQLKLFLDDNPDLKDEFDDFTMVGLKPSEKSFPDKDRLKKTIASLPLSQFEYLCVAYLENDLTTDQQTELLESIILDPEKKRSFELIQKTRLAPAAVSYKHRNDLLRRTPVQRIIRLSVMGLSAAATVALLIMFWRLFPGNLSDKSNEGMLSVAPQNIVTDSIPQSDEVTPSKGNNTAERVVLPLKTKKNKPVIIPEKTSEIEETDPLKAIENDSLLENSVNEEIKLNRIPVYVKIDLAVKPAGHDLIASNSSFIATPYEDERSKISRFIAKTFRDKFLKEKISSDIPLKGYEIAEAGVTGLNKLLGWEMALDERNDENGELRSVYFSSKMLKFNAPVKKTEPLP